MIIRAQAGSRCAVHTGRVAMYSGLAKRRLEKWRQ